MAEAHINTAFGALGALDVLVQRCRKGFEFWERVNKATESMETFKIQLEMYRGNFVYWVQEWGIGKNGHIKDPRFFVNESAVMNYLKLIDQIIHNLGGLDSTFPSLNTAQTLTSMDARQRIYEVGRTLPFGFDDSDGADSTSTGFEFNSERLKWALQDGKLNERLTLLATLIKDLYLFLPPPRCDPAGPIVLSTLLASQDAATLARVSSSIGSALLQGVAWSNSIAQRTLATAGSPNSNSFKLPESEFKGQKPKPGESRFRAKYDGSLVLVEEKFSIVQCRVLNARIENVVLRLQDPYKPAEFRTLPCLGTIEGSKLVDGKIISRYSIVYKLDMPDFFSLRHILQRNGKSEQDVQHVRNCLSLGRRFVIAQTLARAVLYLHLAHWLHKAIRSDNIIFLAAEDMAGLNSALPYLVGFEYSRADSHGELTENIVEKKGHKFYRHPKAAVIPVADFQQPLGGAGRYSKAYDIYSLGVILVELGLFKSAKRIIKDILGSNADPSATDIQKLLLDKAIPEVRFNMGETYGEVARICLDGSFDDVDPIAFSTEFYTKVVLNLELCSA